MLLFRRDKTWTGIVIRYSLFVIRLLHNVIEHNRGCKGKITFRVIGTQWEFKPLHSQCFWVDAYQITNNK